MFFYLLELRCDDESGTFYGLQLSIDRTTSSVKIQTFIERTHHTQPIGLRTYIVAITNFAIRFTSRGTRDERVETPNIKYACNFDLRIQVSVLRIQSSVENHEASRRLVCFLVKHQFSLCYRRYFLFSFLMLFCLRTSSFFMISISRSYMLHCYILDSDSTYPYAPNSLPIKACILCTET